MEASRTKRGRHRASLNRNICTETAGNKRRDGRQDGKSSFQVVKKASVRYTLEPCSLDFSVPTGTRCSSQAVQRAPECGEALVLLSGSTGMWGRCVGELDWGWPGATPPPPLGSGKKSGVELKFTATSSASNRICARSGDHRLGWKQSAGSVQR